MEAVKSNRASASRINAEEKSVQGWAHETSSA
jgi:hypothetical protein